MSAPDGAVADARALAERAFALGLAVTRPDGARVPIPIATAPVVLARAQIARRGVLTARLVSATAKVARAALAGEARERWLGAMRPLERRLVERTWRRLDRLATARVDYSTRGGALAALEVNATIPAMQAYSDIAARAWLEHAGAERGLAGREIDTLVARNGSNADALAAALAGLYASHRPGTSLRTIALLCRRGDAQITELQALRARFDALGYEAAIVHPDEVTHDDPVTARGTAWQLVYRHVFASRLAETRAPLVESAVAAWDRGASLVLNPPAAHLEMKATFAELSRLADDAAAAERVGLDDDERAAVAESVVWTRHFEHGAAELPDEGRACDLVAAVAAEPARYVLKRSWSYGGIGVFIGAEAGTEAFRERAVAAFGERAGTWAALCAVAAREGGFVVQRAAPTESRMLALATPHGVETGAMRVDYAAYASLGVDAPEWGGVVRAAPTAIVNIAGGGGVVPLVREDVLVALEAASR